MLNKNNFHNYYNYSMHIKYHNGRFADCQLLGHTMYEKFA